jgi:hypothetical protein
MMGYLLVDNSKKGFLHLQIGWHYQLTTSARFYGPFSSMEDAAFCAEKTGAKCVNDPNWFKRRGIAEAKE